MSALAIAVCSLIWPAAHLGDEYLPVGNDSFYHARRILDTAQAFGNFYEFDHKIHAPEGSLLTWPWGYDYAMAMLVRAGMAVGASSNPLAILIWIPVVCVCLSIGLIMLIARRMSLPLWSSVLAALCVAISPLTQYLHGTGIIDHHFAEYICVLATIAAGLKWLRCLDDQRAAVALGAVLGVAPAVHSALFILQLPVVATLLALWLQREQVPRRPVGYFTGTLLTATLAILVPSIPFRQGQFEFFLLSWFQLYIAAGTALCCWFFAFYSVNRRSLTGLAMFAALAVTPLVYQISLAQSFLGGRLLRLDSIGEMKSIPRLLQDYGVAYTTQRYSQLLWLLPATWGYCLLQAWRQRRDAQIFFWICALCTLPLLFIQFRLHYFGSFALTIPWLVLIERFAAAAPQARRRLMLACTLAIVLAYVPTLRYQLSEPMHKANDSYFADIRPVLATLAGACKDDPGLVLADHDIGHPIRYFTDCSVIANNFILTSQQTNKILEMERLFELPADQMPDAAPHVKYVLVRPAGIELLDTGTVYVSYSTGRSALIGDLLLKPASGKAIPLPAEYKLLHEAMVVLNEARVPYARLYKIQRSKAVTASSR